MKILIGTLLLILVISPKPGELLLGRFFGRQKTLQMYSRHYQIHQNLRGLRQPEPGKHKVVVDENGKFIIGFAEKHENVYFMHPFLEELTPQWKPRRIKIRIIGKSATSYMIILPDDPLNDFFFKPVNPERLRDVKVIPNPNEDAISA